MEGIIKKKSIGESENEYIWIVESENNDEYFLDMESINNLPIGDWKKIDFTLSKIKNKHVVGKVNTKNNMFSVEKLKKD